MAQLKLVYGGSGRQHPGAATTDTRAEDHPSSFLPVPAMDGNAKHTGQRTAEAMGPMWFEVALRTICQYPFFHFRTREIRRLDIHRHKGDYQPNILCLFVSPLLGLPSFIWVTGG